MPTDGGSPQLPTVDAAGGDAAQPAPADAGTYVGAVDAALVLDASGSDAPPTPVDAGPEAPLLDAGPSRDAGSSVPVVDAAIGGAMDGSVDASAPVPDAGMDAGRVCAAGRALGGYCWFLGELGQSCNAVCAAHGGFEPSLEWIGTSTQGGSLARCDQLLTLLQGSDANTTAGTRSDGRGIGCHLFQGRRWWLVDPAFDPASSHWKANIACSCFDR